MGVLACTVGITALAIGGANDAFTVKADPTEYSVTFDENSSIETHPGSDDYAICTTTARGNKLGVAGRSYFYAPRDRLYFGETNFGELQLHDGSCALINAGANDFDHITGFQITFTGKLKLRYEVVNEEEETFEEVEQDVESGVKYDVSLTPDDDRPAFVMDKHSEDNVTISSLTIWYSC